MGSAIFGNGDRDISFALHHLLHTIISEVKPQYPFCNVLWVWNPSVGVLVLGVDVGVGAPSMGTSGTHHIPCHPAGVSIFLHH